MGSSKLSKDSPAVKLLTKKIRAGKITQDMTPAEIWKSESLFQQYKLPTFRSRLYRVRRQLKACEEDNNDEFLESDLNRRCTDQKGTPSNRSFMNVDEEDVNEAQSVGDVTEEEPLVLGNAFCPLYLISEWTQAETLTKRLSVAILLPSGVGSGDFSVSVARGGKSLELLVCWPTALLHVATLHKKWIYSSDENERLESYHPKILGFKAALKQKRKQATDIVESTARIPLPFKVETHIDGKNNLGWKDGLERIVYVDLKAAVEDYAVKMESEAFEIV